LVFLPYESPEIVRLALTDLGMSKMSDNPMNIVGKYGAQIGSPESSGYFDGEKADVFAAAHVLLAIYTL
jgi:hypothetical protein